MSSNMTTVVVSEGIELSKANDFNVDANQAGAEVKVHASDAEWLKRSGVAEDKLVVANAIPNQAGAAGAYSYTIPANTFAGGADNVLSAREGDDSSLPGWMSFDPATRVLSGTAVNGTTAVKITATSKGGQVVSDTFDVVIS